VLTASFGLDFGSGSWEEKRGNERKVNNRKSSSSTIGGGCELAAEGGCFIYHAVMFYVGIIN